MSQIAAVPKYTKAYPSDRVRQFDWFGEDFRMKLDSSSQYH